MTMTLFRHELRWGQLREHARLVPQKFLAVAVGVQARLVVSEVDWAGGCP